jgi:hypothetical protein
MNETIKQLYEQVISMSAGEGHVTLGELYNDPKATAVISVYHDQRPANEVLEDLYVWAEENGLTMVVEKIHQLDKME